MIDCFRLFVILGVCHTSALASEGARLLDSGWEYHQGDLGGPWEALRTNVMGDIVTWEPVSVPHCFNAEDAVDPDRPYYQGPGWYRRVIDCRRNKPTDRVLIHFGAVGQSARVYVGSTLIADHAGGYTPFVVDLTEVLAQHEDHLEAVPLLVRCDNSRNLEQPPSDLSDFTIYGGLYRSVELRVVPALSIERVGINPTVREGGASAVVRVDVRLRNPASVSGPARVILALTAPDGAVAASKTVLMDDVANIGDFSAEFTLDEVELWSPNRPELYGYKVQLERAGESHAASGRFGLRTFRFEKHGPFFLNDERLLLRGTHRHEDHAGYGAAAPDSVVRDDLILIKQMGANFIRLGHYQQSDFVLDLCDELGLLVWEEIPWCRGGLGGEGYRQMTRRMLQTMIDQHRNHPSVILWGLGNENDWPGDFAEFDECAIRDFMKELHSLAKQQDPSRLTCIRRCEFCKDIVDVYSPSIWAGWYRGRYTDYKSVTLQEMKKVDRFFHAEWGADQHAGRHSEIPDLGVDDVTSGGADERVGDFLLSGGSARMSKDGDWSETYACNLIDWHLKEQETMPLLTGSAYWSFKDFATPLRPENPIPRVNQKGVVQRDSTPKESYYVFQSYWSESPMVRLYGKTWPVRWGKPGEAKLVKVYSNCKEIELFLNGESCGVRRRDSKDFPAAGLRWRVLFSEGKNHLKAVVRSGEATLVDEISLVYQTETWGPPFQLALEVVDESADFATVLVRATDRSGVACLDAKQRVRFTVAGDATLVANLGTPEGSRVVELANGAAQITVAKGNSRSMVAVSAEGMETQFVTIGRLTQVGIPPQDKLTRPD